MSTEEKRQSDSGGPAQVGIVMGSDSDLSVMESAADVLNDFGIAFEITVASAHRSPQRAAEWASSAGERGIKIIQHFLKLLMLQHQYQKCLLQEVYIVTEDMRLV